MSVKIEITFRKKPKHRASWSKSNKYEISWRSDHFGVECKSKLNEILKKIEETRNKLRKTKETDGILRSMYSDLLLAMLIEKRVLEQPFKFQISNSRAILERKIPNQLGKKEKEIYIHYLKVNAKCILSDLFKEQSFKMDI